MLTFRQLQVPRIFVPFSTSLFGNKDRGAGSAGVPASFVALKSTVAQTSRPGRLRVPAPWSKRFYALSRNLQTLAVSKSPSLSRKDFLTKGGGPDDDRDPGSSCDVSDKSAARN